MKILFPFYCLFSYMTFISHIFIIFYKLSGSKESKEFIKTLDMEQKKIYEKIKKERMNDYKIGLLLGFLISFFYMKNIKGENICIFIGIMTLVANSYYLLKPKKNWMIENLKTMEQVKLHNSIYKKFRYMTDYANFIGFIIFMIGYYF